MNTSRRSDKNQRKRSVNDSRRQQLADRFGAVFPDFNSDIPEDVESLWLDNIERYEEAAENAELVTLREYLGDPMFTHVKDLSPERLPEEIEIVLDLLSENNVRVDFLSDVPDADAYAFLTIELMEQVIEDIRVDGFMTCFIYEEFHPNHRMDIEARVNDIFWHLFRRDTQYLDFLFPREGLRDADGRPTTRDEVIRKMKQWIRSIAVFTTHITTITDCTIMGDDAVVRVSVRWSGLEAVTLTERSASGESIFRLHRNFGRWMVVQMNLVGFE
jgi:hypothetical protein